MYFSLRNEKLSVRKYSEMHFGFRQGKLTTFDIKLYILMFGHVVGLFFYLVCNFAVNQLYYSEGLIVITERDNPFVIDTVFIDKIQWEFFTFWEIYLTYIDSFFKHLLMQCIIYVSFTVNILCSTQIGRYNFIFAWIWGRATDRSRNRKDK